jgi:hypothetical protein
MASCIEIVAACADGTATRHAQHSKTDINADFITSRRTLEKRVYYGERD